MSGFSRPPMAPEKIFKMLDIDALHLRPDVYNCKTVVLITQILDDNLCPQITSKITRPRKRIIPPSSQLAKVWGFAHKCVAADTTTALAKNVAETNEGLLVKKATAIARLTDHGKRYPSSHVGPFRSHGFRDSTKAGYGGPKSKSVIGGSSSRIEANFELALCDTLPWLA